MTCNRHARMHHVAHHAMFIALLHARHTCLNITHVRTIDSRAHNHAHCLHCPTPSTGVISARCEAGLCRSFNHGMHHHENHGNVFVHDGFDIRTPHMCARRLRTPRHGSMMLCGRHPRRMGRAHACVSAPRIACMQRALQQLCIDPKSTSRAAAPRS